MTFLSVFSGECSSPTIKQTEGKGGDCDNEELPAVRKDQFQVYLGNLKVCKSMESDAFHP